jgi:hypothetical protein
VDDEVLGEREGAMVSVAAKHDSINLRVRLADVAIPIGSMMEVDADNHPLASLPIDADFFNALPYDFDDQDLE